MATGADASPPAPAWLAKCSHTPSTRPCTSVCLRCISAACASGVRAASGPWAASASEFSASSPARPSSSSGSWVRTHRWAAMHMSSSNVRVAYQLGCPSHAPISFGYDSAHATRVTLPYRLATHTHTYIHIYHLHQSPAHAPIIASERAPRCHVKAMTNSPTFVRAWAPHMRRTAATRASASASGPGPTPGPASVASTRAAHSTTSNTAASTYNSVRL